MKSIHRLTSGQIRHNFIDYFVTCHNHKFIKSSSTLPPANDSILFTNAGMNQFKSIFVQQSVNGDDVCTNREAAIDGIDCNDSCTGECEEAI